MRVTWKLGSGGEISAEVAAGATLKDAGLDNNVPGIIGECGGTMSCATCHVYVDEAWSEAVGGPGEYEDAILDITEAPRGPHSRLSCQIEARDDLDGLVLFVPQG
jgi:2Fe-2S ferredoxin